jgi:hypothetical protein
MKPGDFKGLTVAQQNILTFGGWHAGSTLVPQPKLPTVLKLLERGLVVAHQLEETGFAWTEYEVPVAVHAAWCDHCARTARYGRQDD